MLLLIKLHLTHGAHKQQMSDAPWRLANTRASHTMIVHSLTLLMLSSIHDSIWFELYHTPQLVIIRRTNKNVNFDHKKIYRLCSNNKKMIIIGKLACLWKSRQKRWAPPLSSHATLSALENSSINLLHAGDCDDQNIVVKTSDRWNFTDDASPHCCPGWGRERGESCGATISDWDYYYHREP